MKKRNIPWTPEDLRLIAYKMDEVLSVVGGEFEEDSDWRWGLTVEITDEFGSTVGIIKPYMDGWLGFYPNEVNDD